MGKPGMGKPGIRKPGIDLTIGHINALK